MLVIVQEEIFEKYPEAKIGYLVAQVSVKRSDPLVEKLKQGLKKHLEGQGINATNFVAHPNISLWREIYEEDFHVKAKTYRSSIEALLKRVVTDKEIWNICNIVDLYNCCSILSMLPMGGYDLEKMYGDIRIRFGKEGESFLGLGERQKTDVRSNHVIYADDQRVICWLWNHKDSAETCIDENSQRVIFFIDAFHRDQVQAALQLLEENLKKIGCTPLESGILSRHCPQMTLGEVCSQHS